MIREESRDTGPERLLLGLCAANPSFAKWAMERVEAEDFSEPLHRTLWSIIEELGDRAGPAEVLMRLTDGESAAAASEILNQSLDGIQNQKSLRDFCIRGRLARAEREADALTGRMKTLQGEERRRLLSR